MGKQSNLALKLRHDFCVEVAAISAEYLAEKCRMKLEDAATLGVQVRDFVVSYFAGATIYLPVDRAAFLHKRNWEIYEQFERGSANSLAKKYGLSFVCVYRIARECMKEKRAMAKQVNYNRADSLGESHARMIKRKEIYAELVEAGSGVFIRDYGLSSCDARGMFEALVDFISEKFGGIGLSFPKEYQFKGYQLKATTEDHELHIKAKSGVDIVSLSNEYGISAVRILQVIKICESENLTSQTGGLK